MAKKDIDINERIIKKLLDHDDRFEELEKKLDSRFNDVMTAIDSVLVIVQRIDQERMFIFELYKRLDKDVEKIKKVLKIA